MSNKTLEEFITSFKVLKEEINKLEKEAQQIIQDACKISEELERLKERIEHCEKSKLN